MSKIKVFSAEINDGVSDLVKSQASIAYDSVASIHTTNIDTAKSLINDSDVINKLVAENKDQTDLYYLESVLVSTGANKNDDVFLPHHTWAARNTPVDKQFNYMHDENDIIGHITASRVRSRDGETIASEEVPSQDFDILTQAVIYNSWTNQENQERMERIIAEIKEGKWFVSMECLFAGFDYALLQNGKAQILERNEFSAFLTKYLRAYGGTGKYEDYQVCRVLKNITFSGKGLVSNPANPKSVILKTQACVVDDTPLTIIEDKYMSDVLENQVAELKDELAKAKQAHEDAKAKIEEAKDNEFASKVAAFEKTISEKEASIAELTEKLEASEAKVAASEKEVAEVKEKLAEAEDYMDKMKKKEKDDKRKAALVEAGLDTEEAESLVASFESLDDAAFDAVAGMMKKKAEKKEDKKDEKKDDEASASETDVTPELTEDLENSEATLETETDDSADEERTAIASTIENLLSK